ncbi:anthranilate synthase component I [Archaeoglobales archaeon]|nr:MAG: anthranilate synthase component I [Archaeoglobales archaeon]
MLAKKLDFVEPLKLYNVVREERYPFILESLSKHELKARYTFISSNPEFIVEIKEDTRVDGDKISDEKRPFQALKSLFEVKTDGNRFMGGFVGFVSYDSVHAYFGNKVEEASIFAYYDHVFVYDHISNRFYYLSLKNSVDQARYAEKVVKKAKRTELDESKSLGSEIVGCDAGKESFEEMVKEAKEHVFAGDVFQAVISREYRIKSDLSAFEIYRNLRKINPSPYMFLLEFEKTVVGASPETMASVDGNLVRINPIAGTAPRGENEREDKEIAEELLKDEKERAEHVMLVDLARNDVRKVSKAGSVKLTKFFEVVKYSHVQHIESEVVGELKDDLTMFDAMEAAFPAGTLTGAPKVRAMEIIDELEKSKRRVYGGAVGYFSVSGHADMAIAIRMVEIDDVCRVRAGAGIVADSVPEKEYFETERKMAAVMKALGIDGIMGHDTDSR